jgi:hypothetical protein
MRLAATRNLVLNWKRVKLRHLMWDLRGVERTSSQSRDDIYLPSLKPAWSDDHVKWSKINSRLGPVQMGFIFYFVLSVGVTWYRSTPPLPCHPF